MDFSLQEGSAAEGRGCRVFGSKVSEKRFHKIRGRSEKLSVRSTEEVSGEISESTLWLADTILVVGDITILPEVELEIGAGSKILFADYYQIEVRGNIRAIGSADNRIRFSSLNPAEYSYDGSHRSAWNGIRWKTASALEDSSIFTYCVFEYSKSTRDSTEAGGVFSFHNFSKVKIENCEFRHNTADRGGVIACRTMSNPLLINNLFHDNYGLEIGSVFYNEYSYPRLVNNTITQNSSISEDVWTPSCAISNFFSKPVLINNIIWGNPTTYFLEGEIFEPRHYYYGVNNIDQGLNEENIELDGDLTEEFQLPESSICVDAGEIGGGFEFPEYDLIGNERIWGESIDLGCIEYQGSSNSENLIVPWGMELYPNPFNPVVFINFYLDTPGEVNLAIFNIKGQKVWEQTEQYSGTGKKNMNWQGNTLQGKKASSGVYFFRISTGNRESMKQAVLVK